MHFILSTNINERFLKIKIVLNTLIIEPQNGLQQCSIIFYLHTTSFSTITCIFDTLFDLFILIIAFEFLSISTNIRKIL